MGDVFRSPISVWGVKTTGQKLAVKPWNKRTKQAEEKATEAERVSRTPPPTQPPMPVKGITAGRCNHDEAVAVERNTPHPSDC